ncbi:MAG: hypothetical protein ACTSSJ_02190 [Candidatus Odinarchaeia archaeon]
MNDLSKLQTFLGLVVFSGLCLVLSYILLLVNGLVTPTFDQSAILNAIFEVLSLQFSSFKTVLAGSFSLILILGISSFVMGLIARQLWRAIVIIVLYFVIVFFALFSILILNGSSFITALEITVFYFIGANLIESLLSMLITMVVPIVSSFVGVLVSRI